MIVGCSFLVQRYPGCEVVRRPLILPRKYCVKGSAR